MNVYQIERYGLGVANAVALCNRVKGKLNKLRQGSVELLFSCLLLNLLDAKYHRKKIHTLRCKTENLTASEDQYCYHAD